MEKTTTAPANLSFGGWDSLANVPLIPQEYSSSDAPENVLNNDGTSKTCRAGVGEYARTQQHWLDTDPSQSKLRDHQRQYARMLDADRRLREEYEDRTDVFMTLTQSASDESGNRIHPYTLAENLAHDKQSAIPRKFKRSLGYKDIDNIEWFCVRGVNNNGVTHDHYTILADDPNNVVTADDFMPSLNAHAENVPTAHWDDHKPDGPAVQVQHSPVVGDNGATKATSYTGGNLAHWKLHDYARDEKPNPTNADYFGGTLAWVRGKKEQWVRFSRGI